jgi:hypothetical protein
MKKVYNLRATIFTKVGTFSGIINASKYATHEDAKGDRDTIESKWINLNYIVLFNENITTRNENETLVPSEVLKESVVRFTIEEEISSEQ